MLKIVLDFIFWVHKIKSYMLYMLLLVLLLCLPVFMYDYWKFCELYTPVEGTVVAHTWTKDGSLIVQYRYEAYGKAYEKSERFAETPLCYEPKRGRNKWLGQVIGKLFPFRKSASEMESSYPVGSKHKVYYETQNPEFSHL